MQAKITFISPEELTLIHQASLAILATTGVRMGSETACASLKSCGALVQGENVRFPQAMVQEYLAALPATVSLGARQAGREITLPEAGRCFQSTSGFSSSVMDVKTGRLRRATEADLAEIAVLADYLDVVDMFWPLVMPTDCHPRLEELVALATAFRHTGKHVQCSCSDPGAARWMVRLGEAVAGGQEQLTRQPVFSGSFSPISPLYFDKYAAEAMIVLARAGIPVAPMTMASTGTKAPVTLAGTLALAHAEELAALLLVKSVNPQVPFIYAADVPPADMRSGVVDYASPEYVLLSTGLAQLASLCRLPSMVSHASVEAMPVDTASLHRNILYASWGMMAGSDVSCWMGTFDNALGGSLLHLLKDAETCLQAKAYGRSFTVDPETLALEAIGRVGPGGHFLADPHTLDNLHRDLWGRPWWEGFLVEWEDGRAYQRNLLDKAKEILSTHRPQPLGDALGKEVDQLLQAAAEDLGAVG